MEGEKEEKERGKRGEEWGSKRVRREKRKERERESDIIAQVLDLSSNKLTSLPSEVPFRISLDISNLSHSHALSHS